jgi:hypothetical protein
MSAASLALGRQRRLLDAAVETEQLMWTLSYSRVAPVPTVVDEAVVADDADVVEVASVLLPDGHAAAV